MKVASHRLALTLALHQRHSTRIPAHVHGGSRRRGRLRSWLAAAAVLVAQQGAAS